MWPTLLERGRPRQSGVADVAESPTPASRVLSRLCGDVAETEETTDERARDSFRLPRGEARQISPTTKNDTRPDVLQSHIPKAIQAKTAPRGAHRHRGHGRPRRTVAESLTVTPRARHAMLQISSRLCAGTQRRCVRVRLWHTSRRAKTEGQRMRKPSADSRYSERRAALPSSPPRMMLMGEVAVLARCSLLAARSARVREEHGALKGGERRGSGQRRSGQAEPVEVGGLHLGKLGKVVNLEHALIGHHDQAARTSDVCQMMWAHNGEGGG